MDIDYDKIDDCTLTLLYLVTSEGNCGARALRKQLARCVTFTELRQARLQPP